MTRKKYFVALMVVLLVVPSFFYVYSSVSTRGWRESLNWYPLSKRSQYNQDPPEDHGYIHIRYVYEDGKPVKGLHVNIVCGTKSLDLKTDDNGELWMLLLNTTSIHTYHKKNGYYSEIVQYEVKTGRQLFYNHTIRQYKGTRFYVIVNDGDGDPIPNATVWFNSYTGVLTNEVGACYLLMDEPATVYVWVRVNDKDYKTSYTVADYWFWDKLVVYMN